ncbi:fungal-specific transcription factor domain-containing protein, partial [Fusarium oxysporum]
CNQCRQRKIRCDRVKPCHQCSDRSIQCTYPTTITARPKRKRNPATTEQFYRKIDEILDKIDRINLAIGNTPLSSVSVSQSPDNTFSLPLHNAQTSSESGLEDDDHLAAQATFATNYLQFTIENHLPKVPAEVKSSLDALKRIVGRPDDQTVNPQPVFSRIGVSRDDLRLPPIWLGMLAIQKVKDIPSLDLSCLLEFNDVSHFIDYFLNGYSEKASLTDLVILHCGLYDIFIHYGHVETDLALKEELFAALSLCRTNLDTMLANLPFNLPCNIHTTRALLMTACYYLNECKMSLAWNHIAAAAQMCFKLGLHTDLSFSPGSQDARSSRARLFWFIYMLDKILSLRLNRPFVIDDRNVSARLDCIEMISGNRLCRIIPKWIKISMMHGKVYHDIYSAKALLELQDVREARARSLANELETLFHSTDPVECLEQQRACLAQLEGVSPFSLDIYTQWAIIGWPFVPFVVMFCNTIETRDSTRLAELLSVIEPLKTIQSILPTTYKKQLRLLMVMYDVASKYLGSRSDMAQTMGFPLDIPFNLLFSQVGMSVPSHDAQMQQDINESRDYNIPEQTAPLGTSQATQMDYQGLQNIDYGSQLGHWFEYNQQVLQALEGNF